MTGFFDYWGLQEMIEWSNGGSYTADKLPIEKQMLRKKYGDINRFAVNTEAIYDGQFFDLQYAQDTNHDNRKYSYLRYTENQKMLFVFNFDQQQQEDKEIFVRVPGEAWLAMGILAPSVSLTEITVIAGDSSQTEMRSKRKVFKNQFPTQGYHHIVMKMKTNSFRVFEIGPAIIEDNFKSIKM